MTVGERLKHLREQLGMSQVDLASKINVSKQTLYKYENDIITNIPSDKIESAAKVCNVSPAYLMGWSSLEPSDLETHKEISSEDMPGIGKRIRSRREQLGMTQEELASRLGYKSKTTIAKIENGTNDIVQSKVLEFAKVLNTTPAYLMGWTPEQTSDFMVCLPDGSELFIECKRHKDLDSIRRAQRLLSYYVRLNEIGQRKAMDNLEDLSKIYSVPEAPQPQLNAAHSRTDISDADRTQEAKKAEEDIMDDPNF